MILTMIDLCESHYGLTPICFLLVLDHPKSVLNEAACWVNPLATHPASLALDPRTEALIQVHGHPVCDAGDQRAHILLHAFHTQHTPKRKQAHHTSPVDSVLEHLIHHTLEAVVGCVRSDVELQGDLAERLPVEQLKLVSRVPESCLHGLYATTRGGGWRPLLTTPVPAVDQQAVTGGWGGLVSLSPHASILWPQ